MESKHIEKYLNKDFRKPHKVPKRKSSDIPPNIFTRLAIFLVGLGIFLFIASYAPSAWYSLRSQGGKIISNYLLDTAEEAKAVNSSAEEDNTPYKPPLDKSLPLGAHLVIEKIGVETQIHEAAYDNYEEALKKGVWRVPDFATPDNNSKPIILAAHRFGYLKWSNIFRRKHSFYNLPKLEKGDTVEIVWQQRKYIYEVYELAKGDKISDYSADLILYTCQDLTSDTRIFAYARLLKI